MQRIIAKFHPQAWVNDYAVSADPEGEVVADITDDLLRLNTREQNLSITDDSYESDDLRFMTNTPKWWTDWRGPFWIEVRESIHEYYNAQ